MRNEVPVLCDLHSTPVPPALRHPMNPLIIIIASCGVAGAVQAAENAAADKSGVCAGCHADRG